MLLEVCASSYTSAINAQSGGAHRVELCSELGLGGITPSYGMLKHVLNNLSIPVYILIRPRSGNFTYSNAEFDAMKANILLYKKLGCHGIVSGVLNLNSTIDLKRTEELITLTKPLPFTFHRAFDCVKNPFLALEQLIELKADRILSSGQQPNAEKGIVLLNKLKEKAQNKIIILPGSGINVNNVSLFKEKGFKEIHSSASKNNLKQKDNVFSKKNSQIETQQDIVASILNKLK